jgi:ABC-type bacteriocin/lantibiotic exporter with double-glycine peptidase domain
MVVSSFIEAISIGSVLPFLAALTTPEKLSEIHVIKKALAYLGINGTFELRVTFTLLFVGLVLVSGLFRILFYWVQIRLSMAIGIDFSVQVYENTLYQPYGELITRNSSEILAGSQKAKDLVGYIIQPTLTFLSSIFILVVVLATLFVIEPVVAISGVVGFGALYVCATTASKRFLQTNSRIYATELGRVNKAIQEGVGGIRDVIIDGTQATFTKEYRRALTRMQYAAAGNVLLSQFPRLVIEMLGMVLLAGITLVMVGRDGNFAAAIPALGVVALGAQRLLPVLQQGYTAYITIRGGIDSTTDALRLLDLATSSVTAASKTFGHLIFEKTLRIESLSFSYRQDSKPVLKDVNIEIRCGERVGLIGATGSGKSTLVDLIMGLLSPSAGGIFVDGQKLCDENVRKWQSSISHVPQSIYLADLTVAENIAFGIERQEIDMVRVCEAARIAQISQSIESLPEGYQTLVGERGIRLSGGQRQRIGLARAIYKQSKVLILDEATSALDGDTENAVMDAIDEIGGGVTMVLIAHRITTLKNCHLILEMKDGSIGWSGTYSQLEARQMT